MTNIQLVEVFKQRLADNIYSAILRPNQQFKVEVSNSSWIFEYVVDYDKQSSLIRIYDPDISLANPVLCFNFDKFLLSEIVTSAISALSISF